MTAVAELRSTTSGAYDHIPFDRPPVIGVVHSDVLDNLADRFPDKIFPNQLMEVNDLERPLMRDARRILDSVTAMLNEDAFETTGKPYARIEYDIDTRPVVPGSPQREYSKSWHNDGFYQSKVMLLSSNLPTEFLIEGSRPLPRQDFYRLMAKAGLSTNPLRYRPLDEETIQSAITAQRLEIARPNDYEVVLTEHHLHRSTMNLGTTAIDKIFVRARLTEAK